MIDLKSLLTPAECLELDALVRQATREGAQAIRLHSAASGVLVIGMVAGGELLTWFASPARNQVEAVAVEATVLAGLRVAAAALCDASQDLAMQAIERAKAMH